MSRILSQEEIDALIAAPPGDAASKGADSGAPVTTLG